jgi:redox-sensitive bicupin YhaK (pirin superfamily)
VLRRPLRADVGRQARADDVVLSPGQLLYLGPGRDHVAVSAPAGSRVFLLGGVPLGERLLMWWNLVARTPEEIEAAVADWRDGRFGPVTGYDGPPLTAPPVPAFKPNP